MLVSVLQLCDAQRQRYFKHLKISAIHTVFFTKELRKGYFLNRNKTFRQSGMAIHSAQASVNTINKDESSSSASKDLGKTE